MVSTPAKLKIGHAVRRARSAIWSYRGALIEVAESGGMLSGS
jgi:hypothetical protein